MRLLPNHPDAAVSPVRVGTPSGCTATSGHGSYSVSCVGFPRISAWRWCGRSRPSSFFSRRTSAVRLRRTLRCVKRDWSWFTLQVGRVQGLRGIRSDVHGQDVEPPSGTQDSMGSRRLLIAQAAAILSRRCPFVHGPFWELRYRRDSPFGVFSSAHPCGAAARTISKPARIPRRRTETSDESPSSVCSCTMRATIGTSGSNYAAGWRAAKLSPCKEIALPRRLLSWNSSTMECFSSSKRAACPGSNRSRSMLSDFSAAVRALPLLHQERTLPFYDGREKKSV